MWSPKRNTAGKKNLAYELMRTVVPGDIIYSFAKTRIKAIGVACSYCYEYPKPSDFGAVGAGWGEAGWRVDVDYREIPNPIRPRDYMDRLIPHLPEIYSPLQSNGNGQQTFYLYSISDELAVGLARLMDQSVLDLVRGDAVSDILEHPRTLQNLQAWEDVVQADLEGDESISETTKSTLVLSRRGQGKYRSDLLKIEPFCRITRVDREAHLVASHTKPWRDASNEERLDPENGFMLTPNIDHLFDRGFITFDRSGILVVSSVVHGESIRRMGISTIGKTDVGKFSSGQQAYLDWHRDYIFLGA